MTDVEAELAKYKEEYKKVAQMLLAEVRRNGMLQANRFADHGLDRIWLRRILAEVATDAREGGISLMLGERLIVAWAIGDVEALETWWRAMEIAAEKVRAEMENDG